MVYALRRSLLAFPLIAGLAGALPPAAAVTGSASSHNAVPGPVPADVLAVVDGDTIRVRARIWLGQELEVLVRLAGVDAPEIHGRCPAEREKAQAARVALAQLAGRAVRLYDVHNGKYAGRVVARVVTQGGEDLAARLVAASLARRYGGGKRGSWCRAHAG